MFYPPANRDREEPRFYKSMTIASNRIDIVNSHSPEIAYAAITGMACRSRDWRFRTLILELHFGSMQRILVIEDDPKVQKSMTRLFEPEGFTVEIAGDGLSGVQAFSSRPANVVLLDLRMPGMGGRDVCRELKRLSASVPIIVVSATSDEMDKVLLLELGADDYVTKPFSPRELLARVRAALRRSARAPLEEKFVFDEVDVDFTRMQLTRAGELIPLTAQEFKVLKFMVENRERVISRDELLNEVWGYSDYPSTRTVDNHIMKLRQKLEPEPGNPAHFLTVHGVGYRFVP